MTIENTQKITPFLFEGEQMIRVVDLDGSPWFVVADICSVLDLKNPSQSVGALDDDERAMFNIGRQGDANCVSEGGLYTLILRSRDAIKPGTVAHRFRRWVTGEVLPAIRQSGAYAVPMRFDEAATQIPDDIKLRKVNTAVRCFGERAGAQLWVKLGLDWVPAMSGVSAQGDLLEGIPHFSVVR